MDKSALLRLTDLETIKNQYQTVLGERVHTDGSHPLYNKGVLDGMEIMLAAISASMQGRKQIEDLSTPNDK